MAYCIGGIVIQLIVVCLLPGNRMVKFSFAVNCENLHSFTNKTCLVSARGCCRYVVKELIHAFSCAYIELWMHAGSLESTQEARVALGCASSNSYASFVLSKLPACIHREHTILLSRERVSKGTKRMNSLRLPPHLISSILREFTGKTTAYKSCVTL